MSVRPSHQRRGIGAELLRRLLDWSDNWAGYLRLELDVYTDNLAAISLYEKHGFVNEGRMRMHALRSGAYVDSYRMARLHPRPPQHFSLEEAR
jgi:putative acetyltransferase